MGKTNHNPPVLKDEYEHTRLMYFDMMEIAE